MPKTAKLIFVLGLIGLMFFACREETYRYQVTSIKINDCVIQAEIADTPELKKLGLSGRENLGKDWGMLFVFEQEGRYSFWMKDMRFALDFIWIKDGKVIEITRDVRPPTDGRIPGYRPAKAITYMLEVNAGTAEKCGVKVGDKVVLSF